MYLQSYSCVLCSSGFKETLEHLYFECPFSGWSWRLIVAVPLLDRITLAKNSFSEPAIFFEVVVVAAWCIWLLRNGIIFDAQSLSL